MKPAESRILTINGGWSSIKFTLFEAGGTLRRILKGELERIGTPQASLGVTGSNPSDNFSRPVTAADHTAAVDALMKWIEEHSGPDALAAVGHRIVHGGPNYSEPQQVTAKMVEELQRLSPFDPEHLPLEIELLQAFRQRHPKLSQVACFDTAFHRTMPRVATILPIPRRYEAAGVRRYGFHGLSYEFLMAELARLGDRAATKGRVDFRPSWQRRKHGRGARRQKHRHEHELHADGGTGDEHSLGRFGSRPDLLSGAHRANERRRNFRKW